MEVLLSAASVLLDAPSHTQPSAQPAPSHSPIPATEEEVSTSWAILILVSILVCILLISYFLQRRQIHFIHETVVSIFLGSLVGALIRFSPVGGDGGIQQMVTFDHRYFFNLLLPPIILNSGYDMKRRNFFKNFGSILIFAFFGTFISTIVIGVLIYGIISTTMQSLEMTLLDCFVFGAILSSTDPVTILSIFHQMKVDPKLFAIIFGESILNDSVAIVLFSTLGKFQGTPLTIISMMQGIGSFLGVFSGSVLIGIIIALICALVLKHTHLHMYPSLESCLIALLAYSSYLLSNAIQLSGIVSLLFCGITLKHYAFDNMSIRSRRTTKYMFRVLSQMSENFVFIYLGVTLFTQTDQAYYPGLIALTLLILMLARYVSTVPLAHLINTVASRWSQRGTMMSRLRGISDERTTDSMDGEYFRTRSGDQALVIPRNHQLMIWWAGLRGAIAFALAFNFEGKAGPVVRTTTLAVCVVSIVVLGGTTHLALERLHIRTGVSTRVFDHRYDTMRGANGGRGDSGMIRLSDGVVAESDSSEDEDDGGLGSRFVDIDQNRSRHNGLTLSSENATDVFDRGDGLSPFAVYTNDQAIDGSSSNIQDTDTVISNHWFLNFDSMWLKPLFTQSGWGRRATSRSSTDVRFSGRSSSPSREPLFQSNASATSISDSGDSFPSNEHVQTAAALPRGSRRVFGESRSELGVVDNATSPAFPLTSPLISRLDKQVGRNRSVSASLAVSASYRPDPTGIATAYNANNAGSGVTVPALSNPAGPRAAAVPVIPVHGSSVRGGNSQGLHGGVASGLISPVGSALGGSLYNSNGASHHIGHSPSHLRTDVTSHTPGHTSLVDTDDAFLDIHGDKWKPKK
ncbi:hypothetical protein BASA60_004881 [Batrachochytrium salamandrivorans]|nr:hypothetical protein BASA60_004881 [Batrachochytrium salamandrivorans]